MSRVTVNGVVIDTMSFAIQTTAINQAVGVTLETDFVFTFRLFFQTKVFNTGMGGLKFGWVMGVAVGADRLGKRGAVGMTIFTGQKTVTTFGSRKKHVMLVRSLNLCFSIKNKFTSTAGTIGKSR